MRDGYNSASRYYLCHVRDAHRQAAMDIFLGRIKAAEEDLHAQLEENSTSEEEIHEELRQLVQVRW